MYLLFFVFFILILIFLAQGFVCIFSAVSCILPTVCAAPGFAFGYFFDQQRLHCSHKEHTGRKPVDALYSTLWRILPFKRLP